MTDVGTRSRSRYRSIDAAASSFASAPQDRTDLLVRCFVVGHYFRWCTHEGRAELDKLDWYQQRVPWHQHLARVVLGDGHPGVFELSWQCEDFAGTEVLEDKDRLTDFTRNPLLVVTVFTLFAFALDRKSPPTPSEMALMAICLGYEAPIERVSGSDSSNASGKKQNSLRVWRRRIKTVWEAVHVTARAGVFRCHGIKIPGPGRFALSQRRLKQKADRARAARKAT